MRSAPRPSRAFFRTTLLRSAAVAIGATCLLAGLTGCTESSARPPVIPKGADRETRQRVFSRYHLEERWGSLSSTWTRGNEELSFGEISALAERYTESAAAYHAAQNRRLGLGTMLFLGSGILGFTATHGLLAKPENQMSGTAKGLLYTTGGALVLTPLIILAVTSSPEDEVAPLYNAGLRRELELPDPKPPAPPLPSALLEHAWKF
jgi:hypothetical protein